MQAGSPQPSSYRGRASLRSRISASLLSLAVSLLIVVMLLTMGAVPPRFAESTSQTTVVELMPEAAPGPAPAPRVERATRPPTPVPPPPIPPPPIPSLNMLVLSREEFAATDIAKLPRQPADAAGAAGAGQEGQDASAQGQGPNGERLYNAEWYRKPTRAEMATYLPSSLGGEAEWGMIACRTVEKYRVEDCQELAESPSGSGLARALRQAAWQFLVRPPRIGGRPVVGAWVRIRFDFTHDASGDTRASN